MINNRCILTNVKALSNALCSHKPPLVAGHILACTILFNSVNAAVKYLSHSYNICLSNSRKGMLHTESSLMNLKQQKKKTNPLLPESDFQFCQLSITCSIQCH
jgi:hypothetical protein